MTLDKAIAHYEDVARFLDLGCKGNGNTHREIANYLKRLKELEDMITKGELVYVNSHE